MNVNGKQFRRRGSMLIQQIILIGLSGILMMLAIKLIHRTLDFASLYQLRFNEQRSMSVLARTFRSDLHAARSANLVDENHLELKTIAGSRILYRIDKSLILREAWGIGSQESTPNQPYATSIHRLGENQSALFSIDNDLATINLETKAGNDAGSKSLPHRRLVIRAGHASLPEPREADSATQGSNREP